VAVVLPWSVAVLTASTCAPAIASPDASRTVPAMVPAGNWARQTAGVRMLATIAAVRDFTRVRPRAYLLPTSIVEVKPLVSECVNEWSAL
jgi:hypothetical protein